jgi:hypothetical protein
VQLLPAADSEKREMNQPDHQDVEKRQETLIALILGGSLLLAGIGWLGTGDSLGAKFLSLLFMVIPGTIITIYGINLLLKSSPKQAKPSSRLKVYDWILILVGLGISFLFVVIFIWGVDQS